MSLSCSVFDTLPDDKTVTMVYRRQGKASMSAPSVKWDVKLRSWLPAHAGAGGYWWILKIPWYVSQRVSGIVSGILTEFQITAEKVRSKHPL